MDQEKIGKFIQECRKEKNMTQQNLADKLKVSNKTIGNWENGRNMPDLSLFKSLCNELGITADELILGERIGDNKHKKEKARNLIADLFLEKIDDDEFISYSDSEILNTLTVFILACIAMLCLTNNTDTNGSISWLHIFPGLTYIFIALLPISIFKTFKVLTLFKRIFVIVLYLILIFVAVLTII